MEFIIGLPHLTITWLNLGYYSQGGKFIHFILVKTTDSVKDYANKYVICIHLVHFLITLYEFILRNRLIILWLVHVASICAEKKFDENKDEIWKKMAQNLLNEWTSGDYCSYLMFTLMKGPPSQIFILDVAIAI